MNTFRFIACAVALIFGAVAPAAAQYQVPKHAVPVGRGAGVTGYGAAVPGVAGRVLADNGPSSDPSFTPVGGVGGLFDTACSSTIGRAWVRMTGGWGCASLGWVNPVWWGAVGDGSTDNTVAFNATAAAISSTGGLMFIPPGSYCLKTATAGNSAFVVNSTRTIRIVGAGGRDTVNLNACGSNVNTVHFDAGERSTIEHLEVFGMGAPNDTGLPSFPALWVSCVNCGGGNVMLLDVAAFYGTFPIEIQNVSTCVLENIRVAQGYGAANLYIVGADGCRISGNSIHDQNLPVVQPLPGQTSVNYPNWAAATFFGASFTASISGTVMTVTGSPTGTLKVGELVVGAGVAAGTQIQSLGTGAGGAGTYNIFPSQTVASESMTGVGDIVTNGSYRLQLATAGTSGGTAPINKPYGQAMTDGGAVWQLAAPVGASMIFLDSGASETIIDGVDISGYFDYDLQTGDSLATGGPTNISIMNATLGGSPLFATVRLTAGGDISIIGTHLTGPTLVGEQIITTAAFTGGLRLLSNRFINYGAVNYAAFFAAGNNYIINGNKFDGGRAIGTQGTVSNLVVDGNVMNGVSHCLDITGAGSDYNIFTNNVCNGATIFNASTQGHNFIVNNPGYNPVGASAAANVCASPCTITAGPSPETHYLKQTATNTATVAVGGQQVAALLTASAFYPVDLGPNESMVVTWATTAPTDTKFVH